MTPAKAHAILLKSGLPKIVLAQIWKLADYDKFATQRHHHPLAHVHIRDNVFNFNEFAVAMHLSSLAKIGFAMPDSLPDYLLPISEAQVRAHSGSCLDANAPPERLPAARGRHTRAA